jgi:serine protease inhibitor ecotin
MSTSTKDNDNAASATHRELKPYPPASDGMKRLVITLEGAGRARPGGGPVAGENDMVVELIAGAKIMTDGVNHHTMAASIKEGTVQGWGYVDLLCVYSLVITITHSFVDGRFFSINHSFIILYPLHNLQLPLLYH